jgi:hypothetical protein
MDRMIWVLALNIAASLAAMPTHAAGTDLKLCGGRFIDQPVVPLQPGCQRWDCQFTYRPAKDEKGIYCVRALVCGVYCPKPKPPPAAGQIFDNWNAGGCSVTDVATLTIARPVRLQRIDIWYHWRQDETSAHYTASLDGEVITSGELARAECAPNQAVWCVARVEFGADIQPGTYTYRTERQAICQNGGSKGQGFIRAYGATR